MKHCGGSCSGCDECVLPHGVAKWAGSMRQIYLANTFSQLIPPVSVGPSCTISAERQHSWLQTYNLNCVFLAEFRLHKYVQRISRVYIRYHSVGAPQGHISQVCLLEPAGNVSPASLLEPERVHLWTKAYIVGLWDSTCHSEFVSSSRNWELVSLWRAPYQWNCASNRGEKKKTLLLSVWIHQWQLQLPGLAAH